MSYIKQKQHVTATTLHYMWHRTPDLGSALVVTQRGLKQHVLF